MSLTISRQRSSWNKSQKEKNERAIRFFFQAELRVVVDLHTLRTCNKDPYCLRSQLSSMLCNPQIMTRGPLGTEEELRDFY